MGPRPHLWNRGFEWHDRAGPFAALDDGQVRECDRHGYVVIPGLVPADLVAEATAAIDPFDARTEAFLRSMDAERLMIAEAGAITFSVHLAARSPVLRRLVTHPSPASTTGERSSTTTSSRWAGSASTIPRAASPHPCAPGARWCSRP